MFSATFSQHFSQPSVHNHSMPTRISLIAVLMAGAIAASAAEPAAATSPPMLSGPWLPENPHQLDFQALPKVPSQHVVISEVRAKGSDPTRLDTKSGGVNQHNYLAHHDGQFWAMWSDGPGIEDRVGQRVKFATSPDGLKWTAPQFLTPVPPGSGPESPHYGTRTAKGMRWISRGLWKREGELLALAAAKKLGNPKVLRAQTERMLADAKAARFITDFTDQWLDFWLVDDNTPHSKLYPEFRAFTSIM